MQILVRVSSFGDVKTELWLFSIFNRLAVLNVFDTPILTLFIEVKNKAESINELACNDCLYCGSPTSTRWIVSRQSRAIFDRGHAGIKATFFFNLHFIMRVFCGAKTPPAATSDNSLLWTLHWVLCAFWYRQL